MTRVQADIEALKGLRQALLVFARAQVEALEAAEREIQLVQQALDESERYWRHELERRRAALEGCMVRAMMADQQGHAVDCSPYQYALLEAEERLARVLQWQVRVQEEIIRYRSVAERYRRVLENDLPRATSFLSDRVTALEAYYASRVFAEAVGLAAAGVAGVMGAAIWAVRRSAGELSRVMGSLGEQVAAQVLSEKFGLEQQPFDQPKHGFDRVFRAPGMPLVVMESKVSSHGELRLDQTAAGRQGSPAWIAAEAAGMSDRDSAGWSPANERIARMVEELGPENVPVVSVVVNPASGQADIYWREGSDWRPLGQGVLPGPPASGPSTRALPETKEGSSGGPERRG